MIFIFNGSGEKSYAGKYLEICDFSFNDGIDGMLTDHWNTANGASFDYSENLGMDDSGCLVIKAENEDDARFIYKYNNAVENTFYRMSVWVKTENVGVNKTGANISILNTRDKSNDFVGNNDWQYIEYYGKTAENQKEFTVCLRLGFYGEVNTGTVYFDDFKLEQLVELPKGAVYSSMEDIMTPKAAKVQKVEQHSDTMITATILVISLVLAFVVAFRYSQKNERENLSNSLNKNNSVLTGSSSKNSILVLILLGFALRIIMSGTMPQCDIDVNLFQFWGNKAAEVGIPEFYAHAEEFNCDYPPLFMYYLYFIGVIAKTFNLTTTVAYDMLLKLPSILADCAIAFIIYKIASKKINKSWVSFTVALWLFNPMVILDSACWGQVDSILALAFLLAVYYITKEQYIFSAIAIAMAIALKPQGMFIVPILGFALLRRLIREKNLSLGDRLMPMVYSILAFAGSFLAVMLPFGARMKPNFFSWIFDTYLGTANGYKYATVNSFDFFYLFDGNWVEDSKEFFMGLSYFHVGMAFVVIICIAIGVMYIMSDKKDENIYLMSATLVYAVTMFAPRMHERYFYPALALLIASLACRGDKVLLGTYSVISISNFYTVLEVMTGISIGGKLLKTDYATAAYYYWPPINGYRFLLALINVVGAIVLLAMSGYIVYKENSYKRIN